MVFALRIALQFLVDDLEEKVREFSVHKKRVYKKVTHFCKAFNDLEGPANVTSVVVPYAGKLWVAQVSFKEGPLIVGPASTVCLAYWGLYISPCNF